jgi:uncharacterized protein
MSEPLKIFPLPLVLNPGGRLSLRIFEQRYLNMVRDCGRENCCFGIVSVQAKDEHSRALSVIGTEARIVDFYTLPDGLLGIEVVGERRFRMMDLNTRDDGLHLAPATYFDEITAEVPPEYALLANLVSAFLNGPPESVLAGKAPKLPGVWRLDDANWVAFRMAEMLPLELQDRQLLLEQDEPMARLQLLLDWLPRFQRDDDDSAESSN